MMGHPFHQVSRSCAYPFLSYATFDNVFVATLRALHHVTYVLGANIFHIFEINVKKLQFIHTVNGDGSKTAKIIKRQC